MFKNKFNLFTVFLAVVLAFSSCSKEDNPSNPEAYNVDIDFQIFIQNTQGQDMLNPDVNKSYSHSGISLYSDSSLSQIVPDSFLLSSNGKYFLNLSGGGKDELRRGENRIKYGTQYLKLNSSTVDTIYSETIYIGESLLLNKVLYNSKEIYNIGDNRDVVITKE